MFQCSILGHYLCLHGQYLHLVLFSDSLLHLIFCFINKKMTVSYTADVANASNFGVFTNILIKWKGSVYKLVYKELMAFLAVYFALNIFYRTILTADGMEYYRYLSFIFLSVFWNRSSVNPTKWDIEPWSYCKSIKSKCFSNQKFLIKEKVSFI